MSVPYLCIIPGCETAKVEARGMCVKHYTRFNRGQIEVSKELLERCRKPGCGSRSRKMALCEKHFQEYRSWQGPTTGKPFRGKTCMVYTCENLAGFTRGVCKWHQNWASKYKFSIAQTVHILNTEHPCEICGVALTTKNLNVDHDHSCCPGQQTCGNCVRGFLCRACNRAIGSFGESLDNIIRAVTYLQKSSRSKD